MRESSVAQLRAPGTSADEASRERLQALMASMRGGVDAPVELRGKELQANAGGGGLLSLGEAMGDGGRPSRLGKADVGHAGRKRGRAAAELKVGTSEAAFARVRALVAGNGSASSARTMGGNMPGNGGKTWGAASASPVRSRSAA